MRFYLGLSFFDINKPNESFLGSSNSLSSALVFNGGFKIYQEGNISVFPEILYTLSSANNVVNTGFRFQYDVRQIPNQIAAWVDILTKYVPGRSGILGFQFHTDKVSLGVSYDFPVFKKFPFSQHFFPCSFCFRPVLLPDFEYARMKGFFVLPEIVSQMEKTQDIVIRACYKNPLLISGPAGSGKTTLALHRIAYLLQAPDTNIIYDTDPAVVFVQDDKTKEYFSKIMDENKKLTKLTLKPMIVSFMIVLIALPLLSMLYIDYKIPVDNNAGNVTIENQLYFAEVQNSSISMTKDGKPVLSADMPSLQKIEGKYYKIEQKEGGITPRYIPRFFVSLHETIRDGQKRRK